MGTYGQAIPAFLPALPDTSAQTPAAIGAPRYRARLVTDPAEFEKLAPEWQRMLMCCEESGLTWQHEWLRQWLHNFPPERLFVVLVYNLLGQPVAAAPLMIRRKRSGLLGRHLRCLQFIGSSPDVYDWARFMVHSETELEEALLAISDTILNHQRLWDVVDLRFCRDARQLEHLLFRLRPVLHDYRLRKTMGIPVLELPEDVSTYRSLCQKKKYANDLKRIRNLIRSDFGPEDQARLEIMEPSPESGQYLHDFLEAHGRYWLKKGWRTEYRRHPELDAFYRAIHRKFGSPEDAHHKNGSRFIFSMLKIGGEPASCHFDIEGPDGCMGYLSTYNPAMRKYRPGILHIEAMIERGIGLGHRTFALGRGDENYKNQWNTRKMILWNFLGFKNPFCALAWRLDEKFRKLRNRFSRRTNKAS